MANSKLSYWAVYYENYHIIFSGLLLLLLVTNNWGYILPTTLWLAYSLYRAFWPTEIPGWYGTDYGTTMQ